MQQDMNKQLAEAEHLIERLGAQAGRDRERFITNIKS